MRRGPPNDVLELGGKPVKVLKCEVRKPDTPAVQMHSARGEGGSGSTREGVGISVRVRKPQVHLIQALIYGIGTMPL